MTNKINRFIDVENAICYSGFRKGQSPITGVFPSTEEIKQDLEILSKNWKYLRLYDCSYFEESVLKIIRDEGYNFKVMLGAYVGAEINNPNCPWGGWHSEEDLEKTRNRNRDQMKKLVEIANKYRDIVFSISVGNEATVDWTDHLIPQEKIVEYVEYVKMNTDIPVTFCENYSPWIWKIEKLANSLDFISIHTYPVWEYKNIDEALEHTKRNYYDVQKRYPKKQIVITEAGWPTKSNGQGVDPSNTNVEIQNIYYKQLEKWGKENNILIFVFEAFDEPWKGSYDEYEPEKHWGLFYENRTPKFVVQELYDND